MDSIISLHKVNSSNIQKIGYDPLEKKLFVQFRNGVYCYRKVSKETYESFSSSESIGSYFFKNIKNKYECEKL